MHNLAYTMKIKKRIRWADEIGYYEGDNVDCPRDIEEVITKNERALNSLIKSYLRIRLMLPSICSLLPDDYTKSIIGKILYNDEHNEESLAYCKKEWHLMYQRAEGALMFNMLTNLQEKYQLTEELNLQLKDIYGQLSLLKESVEYTCKALYGDMPFYEEIYEEIYEEHSLLKAYIREVKYLVSTYKEDPWSYLNKTDKGAQLACHYAQYKNKITGEGISSGVFIGKKLFPITASVIADIHVKHIFDVLFAPFEVEYYEGLSGCGYRSKWKFDEKFIEKLEIIEMSIDDFTSYALFFKQIYYILHARKDSCEQSERLLLSFDAFWKKVCDLANNVDFRHYKEHFSAIITFKKKMLEEKKLIDAILEKEEQIYSNIRPEENFIKAVWRDVKALVF